MSFLRKLELKIACGKVAGNVGGFGPGVEFSNCPPGTAVDFFD